MRGNNNNNNNSKPFFFCLSTYTSKQKLIIEQAILMLEGIKAYNQYYDMNREQSCKVK
jgi:hypothetical protein